MPKSLSRIAAVLLNEPWGILPQWLQEMYAIFLAHNNDLSALTNLEGVFARGIPEKTEDETALAYSRRRRGVYRRGTTAIIPIQGPIFPKANLMTDFCGATSLENIMGDFQEASADDDIRNIVFPANSPGGVVTMVDEFSKMLAKSNKPTFGHVSGMGASAMYWILSQMGEVSLSPTSSVGSIGVIMSMTKYKKTDPEAYPKELQFISSISPKKRLDPESKEGEAEIYTMVNKIAEVFAGSVAVGRKVSLETVLENFGKGGMITGDTAVSVGMADRVDTLEELLTRLDEDKATFYSYGESTMKYPEYKAKFPGEYDALRAEILSEGAVTLSQVTTQVTTLSTENARLKADLEKAQVIAAEQGAQLRKLEKESAIKAEKSNALLAETIFGEVFKASNIPGRLEDKVRKTSPEPEAFTKDGVLDAEGYKAAVTAEVADWAKSLNVKATAAPTKPTVLKGVGTLGAEGDEEGDEAVADATVDAMLARIGIKDSATN